MADRFKRRVTTSFISNHSGNNSTGERRFCTAPPNLRTEEKAVIFLSSEKRKQLAQEMETLVPEHREYMQKLMEKAPDWLFDELTIKKVKKGTIFIEEQTPIDWVYIFYKGKVQASEHRIPGTKYNYMRFHPVEAFGAMEILLDLKQYRATLETQTDCAFLQIRKERFELWLRVDINAMLIEARSMGLSLLEQARRERLWIFLQGRDRLFMLFTEIYEETHNRGDLCKIRWTRQQLADNVGISIRTVNRAIKAMDEEGYITNRRNAILVDRPQYLKMKACK